MSARKFIEPPYNVPRLDTALADWLEKLRRRLKEVEDAVSRFEGFSSNGFFIQNNSDELVLPFLFYGRDSRARITLADGVNVVAQWQALTRASPNERFLAIKQGTTKVFLADRGSFILMSQISLGFISGDVPGKIVPSEGLGFADTMQFCGNFFSNSPDSFGMLDFDLDISAVRSTGALTP